MSNKDLCVDVERIYTVLKRFCIDVDLVEDLKLDMDTVFTYLEKTHIHTLLCKLCYIYHCIVDVCRRFGEGEAKKYMDQLDRVINETLSKLDDLYSELLIVLGIVKPTYDEVQREVDEETIRDVEKLFSDDGEGVK